MSQTTIPLQFEQYLLDKITAGAAPNLDEFVFAYIPNLDPEQPIDRATGLPDESFIVHRQNVDQTARLNRNTLIYSVIVPSNVAPFTFNAMYLHDKNVPDSCGLIVHKTDETKESGMATTKSVAQEYDGAAEIAGIHIDPATWQIDYHARLFGIDEDVRLSNADRYYHTAFVSGFDVVKKAGNEYQIEPGIVYVGGLRCELTESVNQVISTKPAGLYLDVVREGTVLSKHSNTFTIKLSSVPLTDYVENGKQHYVARLAGILANGNVDDWRIWDVVSQTEAEAGAATTARKWTAQRVRQAIAAWWDSIKVPWSKITDVPSTASRNDASTTKLLQAKAMGDHVNSGDHDNRYARYNYPLPGSEDKESTVKHLGEVRSDGKPKYLLLSSNIAGRTIGTFYGSRHKDSTSTTSALFHVVAVHHEWVRGVAPADAVSVLGQHTGDSLSYKIVTLWHGNRAWKALELRAPIYREINNMYFRGHSDDLNELKYVEEDEITRLHSPYLEGQKSYLTFLGGDLRGSGYGLTELDANALSRGIVPKERLPVTASRWPKYSEVTDRPSTTASRTSSSTTTLLQAKAMNDHRGSGDHDGRYYTKSQADSRYATGDNFNSSGNYANLRARATTKGDVGLSNIPNSTTSSRTSSSTTSLLQAKAMNDHRGSGDHDGRYYTKGQVNNLVEEAQINPTLPSNVARFYEGTNNNNTQYPLGSFIMAFIGTYSRQNVNGHYQMGRTVDNNTYPVGISSNSPFFANSSHMNATIAGTWILIGYVTRMANTNVCLFQRVG